MYVCAYCLAGRQLFLYPESCASHLSLSLPHFCYLMVLPLLLSCCLSLSSVLSALPCLHACNFQDQRFTLCQGVRSSSAYPSTSQSPLFCSLFRFFSAFATHIVCPISLPPTCRIETARSENLQNSLDNALEEGVMMQQELQELSESTKETIARLKEELRDERSNKLAGGCTILLCYWVLYLFLSFTRVWSPCNKRKC